jgi:hypothetical protein
MVLLQYEKFHGVTELDLLATKKVKAKLSVSLNVTV